MIDTKELRIRVEEEGKGGIDLEEIHELLDRLEAAESARRDDYQNWMTALDRNAELLAKLEAAEKAVTEAYRRGYATGQEEVEKERDELRTELNEIRYGIAVAHDTIKALRAKIEQMERQEPVATKLETPQFQSFRVSKEDADKLAALPVDAKLYALPGAKGD